LLPEVKNENAAAWNSVFVSKLAAPVNCSDSGYLPAQKKKTFGETL
jgi:hypothetical protein